MDGGPHIDATPPIAGTQMPTLLAAAGLLIAATATATTAAPSPAPLPTVANLPTLPLDALVVGGPRGLAPSPQARALDGQRVRLTGFMARLEDPPEGAFFLVPTPVSGDEGGGGTADLPPEAVRVEVRSAGGAPVRWLAGPLEVTGRFEVGPEEDAEGRVSWFRLVLDRPEDLAAP